MKKTIKIVLLIFASIAAILIIFLFIIWLNSPGKTERFARENGEGQTRSIAAIEKLELGGLQQYLIIRGEDTSKPVILFLHGGPGSPEIAFMRQTNPQIEKDFVMVYWEQRGAGKTYTDETPVETMNINQFISDTKQLSKYLINRFDKEKIYIMGHSWGSMLGILTAYYHPDLFHAYIGIGQVADQYRAEKQSLNWIKKQATLQNNEKILHKINQLKFPEKDAGIEDWMNYLPKERQYVTSFGGGITHELRSMVPAIKMILLAQEYKLGEKLKGMKASLFSLENMWVEIVNRNLFNEIDSMQIPVYIFNGTYDYQTPHSVAKEFFEQLKAPKKEFYTFNKSAHSPLMEEPEKFNNILNNNILNNKN